MWNLPEEASLLVSCDCCYLESGRLCEVRWESGEKSYSGLPIGFERWLVTKSESRNSQKKLCILELQNVNRALAENRTKRHLAADQSRVLGAKC